MSLYGQYSGVVDNLVINNIKYNLWTQFSYSGTLFYASTRYGFKPTTAATWISFFGNGIVRQSIGGFQINSAYSEVQLEFRTIRDNSVLLGVTDTTGSFVYGLYLRNGKLLFQFAAGVGQNAALITNRYYKVPEMLTIFIDKHIQVHIRIQHT